MTASRLQSHRWRQNDAHARDKALYLSWLADAYLTAGEIEQAAVTTTRALELSNGVASIRPGSDSPQYSIS